MKQLRNFTHANALISGLLLIVLVLDLAGVTTLTGLFLPQVADAAVVVVDGNVNSSARTNNHTGAQTVFISDSVGYTFYRDSGGECVYSKTTNSGTSWGTAVIVDAQTDCIRIVVWYDQWTPGDTGDTIHIATMDTSEDGLFYNALDTASDTLLLGSAAVNASANSGQTPTFTDAINTHAITKATDGDIYLVTNDNSDAYIVSCSATCGTGTNWTEVGTSPLDFRNDHNLILPLAGGNVLLINQDISANEIRSQIWNGSSWSGTWSTVDASASENNEYDGAMSASVELATGNIYFAYVADNNLLNDNDDDIRTAVFDGFAWTPMTDVITNLTGRGILDTAIGIDQNNGDIYVSYTTQDTPGTAATGNIYYKESTDAMTSWGAEVGPINSTPGDIRKPALDPGNTDRLYVSWWEGSVNDRFGETLDNIGPDSNLSAQGTQVTELRAKTTNNYLGGKFVINSLSANTVSSITLFEAGTVDGSTDLENIQLFYDLDSSLPYDCVSESYAGGESQFGSTDLDGFDAPDGASVFSGSVVGVGPTQSICLYVVTDVTASAGDGATIEIQITNPPSAVVISGSDIAPTTAVELPGSTTVVSPDVTQTHYHWRNDDGSEAAASSATGGVEDTPLGALSIGQITRLRLGVSVEGSTSSNPISYQLEFAEAAPTCTSVSAWTAVGAADDQFNLQSTVNLTDGADTTNIAIGIGGVTDENAVFLTPNGGVRDTSDTTGAIALAIDEYVEFEFSLVASTSAIEGATYCFRLSDTGSDLNVYAVYAQATINAEVTVFQTGTQQATVDIPAADTYFGGSFVVRENVSSNLVTDITISETGTVDASVGLNNIKLFYDFDTSAPYNCASESYAGSELQFGATDVDGMSAANGSSTFSGSVSITTTQTLCVYVLADVTESAQNGETVAFTILSANSDVVVPGASVSPSTPVALGGSTALQGALITQTSYHWRNDDGSETGATSATAGTQDTLLQDFQIATPIRLRMQLSNEGATTSVETVYTLEFAQRVTSCSAIAVWTDVDTELGDAWDMNDSANLTHGSDITNIPEADGGVFDENLGLVDPNAGVRETESNTASTTITEVEFAEFEFSLTSTVASAFNSTYCFRLSNQSSGLAVYNVYPEIAIAAKRDFKVQQGNSVLSGTTETITAGVDYTAPASSSTAFIRITNTNNTGAGNTTGGGSQDVQENTVYIQNPDNIETSITFTRDLAFGDTFVDWEIVEFIAQPNTDNEMLVQSASTVGMTFGQTTISGAVVAVDDDADVVVFVTGVSGDDANNNFYATQVTADWDSLNSRPVFTRENTGNSFIEISYAVVEYTGVNWSVQRVEHVYTAAGVGETATITPVTSLGQVFIHSQKRMGADVTVASYGHQAYLSSVGAVTFELNPSANMGVVHASVVWVIENQQAGVGAMKVERQSGTTQGGLEPATLSIVIGNELDAVNNSSIFGNSSAGGNNTAHPRATAGLRIINPLRYELWRSDTGTQMQYRVELVQWPVADLAIRQNYYRFYTDNNLLTPDDAWPEGAEDLGENTSITEFDDPPGVGEVLRLRMTLRAKNANWPADFYAFKLQYAERISTCTAVGVWTDVGQAGSGEIWRGFAATGTIDGTDLSGDPATPGDLLISVADVAGSLVHENQSATNTFIAFDGEDVEYDWYLEHNGAAADTVYCFRTVEAGGDSLSGYLQYPQLRTADFTPEITGWRWYDDTANETPSTPLEALNAAPTEIAASSTLALRVVLDEQKSVDGQNVKFKLQFSSDISFSNPIDVVASTTCTINDEWCYVDGGGLNNATITTAITGISDSCVAGVGIGCGTHNSAADYAAGHDHGALDAQEYSFTIQAQRLQSSTVYYFRLFDVASARAANLFDTASYPAAVAESARLVFTVDGLPSATSTAGVTTGVTTTATAIGFGVLPFGVDVVAAQRLAIDTNSVEGYQVWKLAGQQLTSSGGAQIDPITATNATPGGWVGACSALADSCAGYHTTDATLAGGSTRFAATDTYAAFHTTLEEIMFSSIPINETHDVVYRVQVTEDQAQGDYTTNITYIATPIF
jgi:hypothetical protein